jgi:hypothetical protein
MRNTSINPVIKETSLILILPSLKRIIPNTVRKTRNLVSYVSIAAKLHKRRHTSLVAPVSSCILDGLSI